MDFKKLIISSLAGGLMYFMLGYLFYGVLFTNIYPPSDNENLLFDRFVRVFVLRLPSGEVQQRQKLGERSLAGYVIKIARRYRTG